MTLKIGSLAHGGEGVARRDGKTIFVTGAIPGDTVTVEISEQRPKFERGVTLGVVEPSPHRVTPICAHFGECGGCQWQMAEYQAQLGWKRDVVISQLGHIGRIEAEVAPTLAPSAPIGYRNRMDFRVLDGEPAMLRQGSHNLVEINECHLLVHPLTALFRELGGMSGRRVTLRAGINTGETLVLVDDQKGSIRERVGGHVFQITDRAFFQVNTDGAEALVEMLSSSLGVSGDETLVDAYAGVGLFAATVGAAAASVTAIEWDKTALRDLAVNAPNAEIMALPAIQALKQMDAADVVVVDPPRKGLSALMVDELARLEPRAVAYVSCDPASFARDARLLVDAGFSMGTVRPVDMFPQTYHVEIVTVFTR